MNKSADDKFAINDLLARFFQAFDDKNWRMMRGCLHNVVQTDYSSFRDVPPATTSAERYVEQRRAALHTLDMQHNFLNLQIEFASGDPEATARCNYMIYRFDPSSDNHADNFFHSYGHYVFTLIKADREWRIRAITQNLLCNRGNPDIHGATRAVDNTRHI